MHILLHRIQTFTLPLALLFCLAEASAAEPSLVFEGKDRRSGAPCFLYVHEEAPEEEEYYAVVSTSYAHGKDSAPQLTVRPLAESPGTLQGTGENGIDQITLFLSQESSDVNNSERFNLTWQHGTHPHRNSCNDLQLLP